jgi:hypothetical protein
VRTTLRVAGFVASSAAAVLLLAVGPQLWDAAVRHLPHLPYTAGLAALLWRIERLERRLAPPGDPGP